MPTSTPAARTPAPARGVGHARATLPAARWRELADRHADRADALTAGWRRRKPLGEKHAIEDFLFTYYPTRPAQLRRWHPGAGVALAPGVPTDHDGQGHAADPYDGRADWRWYRTEPGGVVLDAAAYLAERGDTVRYVAALLDATAARPGRFGCFGLHEWAMVYRDRAAGRDHRHPLPLRLGHEGTDAVVDAHPVQCSHFDAYRFFTPEAAPLNRLTPTRETQPALEQPGCLHATMDLYKWALKLGPAVPGDVLLDAFDLAHDVREVDMRASPYDVSAYGLAPVAIETTAGKAEYVRHQRAFAERGAVLRERLRAACTALLDGAGAGRLDVPAHGV
ncbi:3-methyladenine DNA glycosylase [Cellulosimicrobium marinum]|uniref:3-methyladenine DNA glycosylase n=1 Tax=Cellulosimicrobium marinum TaxID=1638992 RepID=UPI001E49D95A|nr:3-methyladenine DNA glycosylase [Cellulosimicrobium marinum]MCB7137898.1 3-methyladenine DNA glycosylase [Cellulosimicrobium marinum]